MTIRGLISTLSQQEDLNFLLTNRIPRAALTRFVGWFSKIEHPLIRDLSIACWRLFSDLDLSEARKTDFKYRNSQPIADDYDYYQTMWGGLNDQSFITKVELNDGSRVSYGQSNHAMNIAVTSGRGGGRSFGRSKRATSRRSSTAPVNAAPRPS